MHPSIARVVDGTTAAYAGLVGDEPFVLLIDPDVSGMHRWLDELLSVLDRDASVAAVGPVVLTGASPDPRDRPALLVDHAGYRLASAGREPPRAVARRTVPPAGDVAEDVLALDRGCLLVRRHDLCGAGGLAVDLPREAGDIQLGWRLHAAGRRVVLCTSSRVSRVSRRFPGPVRQVAQDVLDRRHGPGLRRALLLAGLRGEAPFANAPLRVVVPRSGELARACRDRGWIVTHRAGRGPVDVCVVDQPTAATPAGSLVVAWVDDAEAWQDAADLDAAHLVLVTAEEARQRLADQVRERPLHLVDGSRPQETVHSMATWLASVVDHPSIAVRIGARRSEAASWGDQHFAEAFVAELRAAGSQAWVEPRDDWSVRRGAAADVVVHLRGRGRMPSCPAQLRAVWVISHPEEMGASDVDEADVVFTASRRHAERLGSLSTTPVHVLLQATDPLRFHPTDRPSPESADVVFVGNSRFTDRPIVRSAVEAGLPLVVHGANWEPYLPPRYLGRRFIPNRELAGVYSGSGVVLNDHWPGMREWGLVSNRVFDALACEACVVSDHLPELEELFGDAVAMVEGTEPLREAVSALLASPDRRARMGRVGRERVLASHTFRHRAGQFLEVVVPRWRDSLTSDRSGASR